MRTWHAAAIIGIGLMSLVVSLPATTQTSISAAPPAWTDVASWKSVRPVETDDIVYRNVPLIPNPSANASPDPGTPSGIRKPLPSTAPPGTLDLHVDLLQMPSAKPTPVVIQIHGGGWLRGDRPDSYKSFSALLAAGMSVVTVQYRNAKDAPAPAAIQDVRCAMAWVKTNAARYNFDLNRVILYGGSAGGHLALMGGYAPASFNPPGCTDQPKVAAILDFYGPTNLAEGLMQHGSRDFTHQWLATDMPLTPTPDQLGAKPQPNRWPDPDAKTLARAHEMSPMSYIHPGLPPTFIVNGDSDHTVDPTQSAQLKQALDTAGVPNGQDIIAGGGHGNFSPADSDKAMLLCLQFLKSHGILQ